MDYQDIDLGLTTWSNLFREEQEALAQLQQEQRDYQAALDVMNDDR